MFSTIAGSVPVDSTIQLYFPASRGRSQCQPIDYGLGHATNLVASARLRAEAETQNSLATKEQVLLAVDQAFSRCSRGAAQAVLKVAQETVSSRQLLTDQVLARGRAN